MAFCPHCNIPYDEDNATQPCCGGCGHPITCGCDGHSHSRPSRPRWTPPAINDRVNDEPGDSTDPSGDASSDPSDDDTFEPDDDLPF